MTHLDIILDRVTIKNVKKDFGHDLCGFFCDVYLDGKKIGYFNDDGWGGSPELNPYSLNEKAKEKWNEFESLLENAEVIDWIKKVHFPDMDLSRSKWYAPEIMDFIITEILKRKQIEKMQVDSIIFVTNDDKMYRNRFKKPLQSLPEIYILNEIEAIRKEHKGCTICNTNLKHILF